MARSSNLTMCSFCGKSHAEVRKLVAGPGVYICDSCITVCKNILDKELSEESRKSSAVPLLRVPKPAEIKNELDRYVIGQDLAKKVTMNDFYGGKVDHMPLRDPLTQEPLPAVKN